MKCHTVYSGIGGGGGGGRAELKALQFNLKKVVIKDRVFSLSLFLFSLIFYTLVY